MPEPIAVESVVIGDTPRLADPDQAHVRKLAAEPHRWAPILVHGPSMRVVDGVHRLLAARLRGDRQINAILFDGSAESAFLQAVQANTSHGLPLSPAERKSAAARIVNSHPQWSDRAIASVVGLSAKSVAAIRRSTSDLSQSHSRTGLDGRVRPLTTAGGRHIASRILAEHPEASLRSVARAVGVSPATVRDVRDRMRRGDDPVPPSQRSPQESPETSQRPAWDPLATLKCLANDPSVRYTDSGRSLVRWLTTHAIVSDEWREIVRNAPPYYREPLITLARQQAHTWHDFVAELENTSAQRVDGAVDVLARDGERRA